VRTGVPPQRLDYPLMPPTTTAPKSARGTTPRGSGKAGGTPRSKAAGSNPLGGGAKPQSKPIAMMAGAAAVAGAADMKIPSVPKPSLNLTTMASSTECSAASASRDSARKGSSKVFVKPSPRSSSSSSSTAGAAPSTAPPLPIKSPLVSTKLPVVPSDRKLVKQDSASKVAKADAGPSSHRDAKSSKPKNSKGGTKKAKDKEMLGSPFAPRVAPLAVSPPAGLPSLDLLNWTPVTSPPLLAIHPVGALGSQSDAIGVRSASAADCLELEHRVLLEVDENGLAVCSILSRYARGVAGSEDEYEDDDLDLTVSITPGENGKWKVAIFEPEDASALSERPAQPLAADPQPPQPEPLSACTSEASSLAAWTPAQPLASTSADDRITCMMKARFNEEMDVLLDFDHPVAAAACTSAMSAPATASPLAAREGDWDPPHLHVKLVQMLEADQIAISIIDPPPDSSRPNLPNAYHVAAATAPTYDVLITVGGM